MSSRRRIAAAGTALVLGLGAWFVALPMAARAAALRLLRERLQTRVELDGADYAFGSTVRLRGLRIHHPVRDELIADFASVDARFEDSPLATPHRITRLRIDGAVIHAVREDNGRWNFEDLHFRSGEPLRVGSADVRGVEADFARRGTPGRFLAHLDSLTSEPGTAVVRGFALDWADGGLRQAVARLPETLLHFAGEITTLHRIEEAVLERPELFAALAPSGRPELIDHLRAILGTSRAPVTFDRVFIGRTRIVGGAVTGLLKTPEGGEWRLPIGTVEGRLDWKEPALIDVPLLEGRLFGGLVGGSGTVRLDEAADSTFQGTLDGIDLAKLAATTRHASCGVRGSLTGSIDGRLKPSGDVIGSGRFRARDARVWGLPLFRGILTELGIREGADSSYELMQADLVLSGDRFRFEDLKTRGGGAIGIRGEGQMKYDGTGLQVHFWPRPIDSEDVPILGQVSEFFAGTAVTVKVAGTLVDPKVQVVEGVVDLFP